MLSQEKQNNFLECLFRENKRLLTAIALDVAKDSGLIDDILHDVYLSADKNRKTIGKLDPENQRNYLCAATRNQAINTYRRKKQYLINEIPFDESIEAICDVTLEHLVVSRERLVEVKAWISELNNNLREVLERSVFYQFSDEDIAKDLKISVELVRVRKHRAREQLKKKLMEVNGDDK